MRPGPRPLLLALLLGSCYNPDYVGAHFQCDPQQACPSGLNCVQGYCVAGDGGAADGSMAAMPDLSAGRAPDLAGPPPPSGGCKGPGGIQVGPDIYACPGLFPAGQAKDLCRDGYDICADVQMVNAAACGNQGFFATRTQAHRYLIDDPTSSRCGAPGLDGMQLLLVGCGQLAGSTFTLNTACGGLSVALDCDIDNKWSCNSGIDAAENKNVSGSGVLCCKKP